MKKMIVALAIIGLFGSASANSRQIPRRSYQTIIVQEKKTDVMPYVFLGVIAGVVIYHITQTRCDSGLICTKF